MKLDGDFNLACADCGSTDIVEMGCEKADLIFRSDYGVSDFYRLGIAHGEWSQKQFGSDADLGPEAPLAHLAKEVLEMMGDPSDLSEYADGLLLLLDSSRRAGFTANQLLKAAFDKLEINKSREWGEPNEDGSVEHVR